MDAATIQLLKKQTTSQSVRKECIPIVEALETAHRIDNEAECAQQMRDIVQKQHLKFSTLIDRPEILLGASKGCQEGINTALWTRFTVTYNLYAGSIVAMGNDNQREELLKSQRKSIVLLRVDCDCVRDKKSTDRQLGVGGVNFNFHLQNK